MQHILDYLCTFDLKIGQYKIWRLGIWKILSLRTNHGGALQDMPLTNCLPASYTYTIY